MAADGQRFCLKWNDFRNSVTAVFDDLRQDEELVDITLCCEGKKVKAHRMMLSACSPYFRELLKENPCQHPVFFLKDTTFADLRAVIEFVYNGEVNVTQGQLSSFLKTAEMLQVRGLTGDDEKDGTAAPAMAPTHSPARVPSHIPATPQPRAFQRRPSVPPQQPMRIHQTPVKRPMPPTPQMQSVQKRMPPAPPPAPPANNYVPEVVTMPDSPPPPPPPPPPPAPTTEPQPDASPASKRRRYSGSSGGEGPATPGGPEAVPSPSPAASPAGTSSDAPLSSPAPPSMSMAQQQPLTPQQSEPGPAQGMSDPAPPQEYGGHHGGMVKVEKVDIADDDDGLAALGQVVNYEGASYDSDQSLGSMQMGDPSQGGGMFVPGPSDGGAAGSVMYAAAPAGGWVMAPPRNFACQVCGKTYSSRNSLANHMGLHEGRTVCDHCGKRCGTVSARNIHVKTCRGSM